LGLTLMSGDAVRFGRFRLEPGQRELLHDEIPVRIANRALDILRALVSAKGQLVTKDELMAQVWSGLVVEESNIHVHVSALRKTLEEAESGQNYVVTVPGRGYRFVGLEQSAPVDKVEAHPGLSLPDRPSIAVLPFNNLSSVPEQEYFADGVVEDIITALSRMRWLFVIARNSSFTYKGRSVDVKQVGRELGVRYVLEGSVRKAANRVRITGQLIDASTGAHLWADHFDGGLEDIFDLQDDVTASVVSAMGPKLEQAEIERAKRKPTGSLDSYDYLLRGMASVYRSTSADIDHALNLFYRAIELDPDFTTPHGMAAWCYLWRNANGWTSDRERDIVEVTRLARCVAESGKDDAVSLAFGGLALAYVAGDLEDGESLIKRALVLNPNLMAAWYASGWVKAFLGETDIAIEHLARAMRLSPLDPLMFLMQGVTALAYFVAGQYAQAVEWAAKAAREQPNFLGAIRNIAASSALSGRMDEAQKALARVRRLDPELRLSNLKNRVGPYRPADFARFAEGMRLAGLPE
jgi:TolB-like protein/tetratricopeptide (TPR) repeat protein